MNAAGRRLRADEQRALIDRARAALGAAAAEQTRAAALRKVWVDRHVDPAGRGVSSGVQARLADDAAVRAE
jgi:hypothetical protein